jgi:diaminopimelate epimerase
MKVEFDKYHGAGNDFILIDNRDLNFPGKNSALIKKLCDRRFGIGADGLILLQSHRDYDFEMIYFNADGKEGSLCGNGGRCVVAFAKSLGLLKNEYTFLASDGPHEAIIKDGIVSLKMKDVSGIEKIANDFYLNTGSPHYVRFVKDLKNYDVRGEGKKIRYNTRFQKVGTNVNFVEIKGKGLNVRTYERGVEDETHSCGTGVTAAALVAAFSKIDTKVNSVPIQALGGKLKVSFLKKDKVEFSDIWLHGPAEFVYRGNYFI